MSAEEAYQWVVDSVGACLPDRDEVDEYVIDELRSLGNKGVIISSESVLGLVNGVGNIYNAPKPLDTITTVCPMSGKRPMDWIRMMQPML